MYPATTPVNPTALCAATDSASATSGCVTQTQTVAMVLMKMRVCVVSRKIRNCTKCNVQKQQSKVLMTSVGKCSY